jgi:hypothetical protein
VYAKSWIMDLRARAHCLEARAFLVESGGYLHLLESLAPSSYTMRARDLLKTQVGVGSVVCRK